MLTIIGNIAMWFKKKNKWLVHKGQGNIINCPDVPENTFIKQSKLIVRGNNNEVNIGSPNEWNGASITVVGNNNKVTIGKNGYCYFDMRILGDNCEIFIGEHCGFKDSTLRINESNSKIIIGNDGMFAQGSRITCTDFHAILDYETRKPINRGKEIIIGSHCWITVDVKVMKNTHIADDIIVGAGSIVAKDLTENHAIYAGSPAKLIKTGITWSHDNFDTAMQKYLSVQEDKNV